MREKRQAYTTSPLLEFGVILECLDFFDEMMTARYQYLSDLPVSRSPLAIFSRGTDAARNFRNMKNSNNFPLEPATDYR
jgi:hypothetical protein